MSAAGLEQEPAEEKKNNYLYSEVHSIASP